MRFVKCLLALLLVMALFVGCNETPPSETPDQSENNGDNENNENNDNNNSSDNNNDSSGEDDTDTGDEQPENPQNEKIKGMLKRLLSDFRVTPSSYLPASMMPSEVSANSTLSTPNYKNDTSVASIPTKGYGEQWNMIAENIAQSDLFFRVLGAIDGVTTSSVTIFNNYLDKNPDTFATHTFKEGIYTVSIVYENGVLDYVLNYTATLPVVGTQSVEIALSMNESGDKDVRVQLGDANAIRYTVTEDGYEFGIRYLGPMEKSMFRHQIVLLGQLL